MILKLTGSMRVPAHLVSVSEPGQDCFQDLTEQRTCCQEVFKELESKIHMPKGGPLGKVGRAFPLDQNPQISAPGKGRKTNADLRGS